MDPSTHAFDPEHALDGVRTVVASTDPESGRPRGLWSDESVARGLAGHFGVWAYGWLGAAQECPDSGSVITSLPPSGLGARDLEAQAQRYTGALVQWRAWLEELAGAFARLAPDVDADAEDARRRRERGVAPLVALVVERTQAGELWLGPCAQALGWFFECTGMSTEDAEDLADEVVDAHFENWIAPGQEALDRARSAGGGHGA
ncbi:hypothetical protein ACIBL6_29015 [Streptomyces sp. NPDC050400]|uniref:hypothetical protein n=1 Tax=Streptomyces sp. NPDC050400 TaxID=3365610 RepID=UPI0037AE0B15